MAAFDEGENWAKSRWFVFAGCSLPPGLDLN
jgi:hypothetical protein